MSTANRAFRQHEGSALTTSVKVPGAALFACLFVVACAGGPAPGATAQPGATTLPGTDGQSSAQVPASHDPGVISGTWTGTVTRHYTETTTTTGDTDSTVLSVTYDATVQISSTLIDINGWTLMGPATIKATQTSDYRAHFTSTVGTCDKHYHDDDVAEGGSIADGGLGINDDATYEFTLTVPGFDGGTETAMRDETGCLGSSTTEVNPWPVGPVNLEGSGDITDPTLITGSTSKPVANGGQDTVTWSFHLQP